MCIRDRYMSFYIIWSFCISEIVLAHLECIGHIRLILILSTISFISQMLGDRGRKVIKDHLGPYLPVSYTHLLSGRSRPAAIKVVAHPIEIPHRKISLFLAARFRLVYKIHRLRSWRSFTP